MNYSVLYRSCNHAIILRQDAFKSLIPLMVFQILCTTFGSKNMTGFGSRMLANRSPLASRGLRGMATWNCVSLKQTKSNSRNTCKIEYSEASTLTNLWWKSERATEQAYLAGTVSEMSSRVSSRSTRKCCLILLYYLFLRINFLTY
jgi:hypothetical protein